MCEERLVIARWPLTCNRASSIIATRRPSAGAAHGPSLLATTLLDIAISRGANRDLQRAVAQIRWAQAEGLLQPVAVTQGACDARLNASTSRIQAGRVSLWNGRRRRHRHRHRDWHLAWHRG